MNIMLTDIRSLTLDMQEMPVVDQGVGDSFNRVLQQQLPADPDHGIQVVEFEEYFLNSQATEQTSEMNATPAPLATWRDYLSQQQIRVTTDADPVQTIPVDLGAVLPTQPQTLLTAKVQTALTPGEALPVGGNSLPDEAFLNPQVDPKDIASVALRPDAAGTVAGPGVGNSDLELPATPSQLSLNSAHRTITAAASPVTNPVKLTAVTEQAVIAQAAPVRLADELSPAESRTARVTEIVHDSELDARVNKTDLDARVQLTRPQTLVDDRSAAKSLADTRADARPVNTIEAREIAGRELPLPRELTIAEMTSVRPIQPGNAKALQSEVATTIESVAVNDPRDQIKILAQPAKAQTESLAAEFTTNRSPEAQQQVSQSPAQPSLAALSASSPGIATTTMPATNPNPLPAQLESMSLARGAEATEWGNGLGDRVSWMINQKQNSATIRLDPPMLGKLDVQVRIADDATTITIQTQHAQTRELIESASVRLRDFLQESGYQNVNVDVSQRQDQQQARSQSGTDDRIDSAQDAGSDQESELAQHQQPRYFSGDGILDTFA